MLPESGRDAFFIGSDLSTGSPPDSRGAREKNGPLFELTLITGEGERRLTSADFRLTRGRVSEDGRLLSLACVHEGSGLHVQLEFEVSPAVSGVIARTGVSSATACTVRDPLVFLGAKVANPLTMHWVDGVKLAEQVSFPHSFLRRSLPIRHTKGVRRQEWISLKEGARPSSSNELLPWLAAIDERGNALAVSLLWSGLWRTVMRKSDEAVCLGAGLYGFTHTLEGGERVPLPEVFWIRASGGAKLLSRQTHRFLRDLRKTRWPENLPWVQFNSWYPWERDVFERDMLAELDVAAGMGVDVFVIDDGWFMGADNRRKRKGIGDWRVDPEKFPEGMGAFGRKVKAKGLRFGLWVEPEAIDFDVMETAGVKEAWLARRNGEHIVKTRYENGTGDLHPTAVLCFGCPEVVAWAKEWLRDLIRESGADWLKWDHNHYGVCNRPDHGHQAGDGNWAHIRGLYEVLDYLREQFPDLIIENCASGGSRLDPGLFVRSDVAWASDFPAPSQRCRSQLQGALTLFPPEYLNAWVIPHPCEPVDETNLPFLFRSRFIGSFGLSYPLSPWNDRLVWLATKEIALYKAWRALMVRADAYALLPQETGEEFWWGMQLVTPDARESAVLVFREESDEPERSLPLYGLDAAREYIVRSADRSTQMSLTGAALMSRGLPVRLESRKSSALFWLETTGVPS